MKKFGLIGFPLSHSFSQKYFTEKFAKQGLTDHQYDLYPIEHAEDFLAIVKNDTNLFGLNVTIPHKLAVMPFLDSLDESAAEVGAVNVIRIDRDELGAISLTGFNSDVYGFQESLKPLLKPVHDHALILGTGGASKAVAFALKKLGIEFKFVSRKKTEGSFSYNELTEEILSQYKVIVNCSPLGTYPNTEDSPAIPYQCLSTDHLLYDLVYNPAETAFLKQGKLKGAAIKNGYEMLELQAEKAWEIWKKE
ncbi:shikimate dehydrogenase family protein [Solitalea koreensis]|uniref:Shikimate dehydrogenase n=1 Tax=Solitalea koreensis TaxID=543615 RepID=A0A521EF21_9SPHI|nr:shikimate dehydrogenase [Solitalea koreensis]SMO82533.1 shikimate dehydrogenase [Solitalea koreensis]